MEIQVAAIKGGNNSNIEIIDDSKYGSSKVYNRNTFVIHNVHFLNWSRYCPKQNCLIILNKLQQKAIKLYNIFSLMNIN